MLDQKDDSLAHIYSYIHTIDFSPIIHKLELFHGWSHNDAIAVSDMYRKFLYLKRKYGNEHPLPPSEEIDEFWHMHILDTKKYRGDCNKIFGHYLDHYPYFGIDNQSTIKDLQLAFHNMQNLYKKEFNGEDIYQVRTIYKRIISQLKKQWVSLKFKLFLYKTGIRFFSVEVGSKKEAA